MSYLDTNVAIDLMHGDFDKDILTNNASHFTRIDGLNVISL